jgi:hypothetical protein
VRKKSDLNLSFEYKVKGLEIETEEGYIKTPINLKVRVLSSWSRVTKQMSE